MCAGLKRLAHVCGDVFLGVVPIGLGGVAALQARRGPAFCGAEEERSKFFVIEIIEMFGA